MILLDDVGSIVKLMLLIGGIAFVTIVVAFYFILKSSIPNKVLLIIASVLSALFISGAIMFLFIKSVANW